MADLDPLGITTAEIKAVAGIHRRANENVTRKYFNFGNFTKNSPIECSYKMKFGLSKNKKIKKLNNKLKFGGV